MKAPQRPGQRSFANPAVLQADIQAHREAVAEEEKLRAARAGAAEADEDAMPDRDEGEEEEPELTEEERKKLDAEQKAKDASPAAIMQRLGIEFTAEDCNRLLFKGFVAKDIKITVDPSTGKDFIGSFKTLTTEELDLVDELLAEELGTKQMTVAGRQGRHSTWVLAFSLTHINGAELQKPVKAEDGSVDLKKNAAARVQVIRKLSPFVLDKASRIYGSFASAISLIIEDPAKEFLKKP